jgi:hypothetical protein
MYDPLVVDTFARILDQLSLEEPQISPLVARALSSAPYRSKFDGPVVPQRFVDASQLALNSLVRTTNAKIAVAFVTDEDATRLIPVAVSGTQDDAFRQLEIDVGDRLSGWVAANGRPIINSDPALDLGHDLAAQYKLANAVSVPAKTEDGESVAVITAYADSAAAFSGDDLARITASVRQLEPLWAAATEQ